MGGAVTPHHPRACAIPCTISGYIPLLCNLTIDKHARGELITADADSLAGY
jgi:hypothetical protein